MKKSGLCVYHANCLDGFASALAVWLKYGEEWDYVPMQYGDPLPPASLFVNVGTMVGDDDSGEKRYENVMLVDFSLPRDYMIELSKLTNLLVIDHHKTAMEACEGLDFCRFDLSQSGCEATWKFLFGTEPPVALRYIGDRDLWKFKHPWTKAFCAGLGIYEKLFEVWEKFIYREKVTEVCYRGETILKLQEIQVKNFVEQWKNNPRYAELNGFTVPIANCCDLISERIGALGEGFSFAIGYFDTHEKRVFSLRSRNKEVDCGTIAKTFGGGGHPGAAGFSVTLERVDPEMKPDFWEKIKVINNKGFKEELSKIDFNK